MEAGAYPGYPVLSVELLTQVRGTAILEEDQQGDTVATLWLVCQLESQSRSRRREDLHDEALREAREAHQWALEATCMLEQNIERLSQGVESTQYPCPCSHTTAAHGVGP